MLPLTPFLLLPLLSLASPLPSAPSALAARDVPPPQVIDEEERLARERYLALWAAQSLASVSSASVASVSGVSSVSVASASSVSSASVASISSASSASVASASSVSASIASASSAASSASTASVASASSVSTASVASASLASLASAASASVATADANILDNLAPVISEDLSSVASYVSSVQAQVAPAVAGQASSILSQASTVLGQVAAVPQAVTPLTTATPPSSSSSSSSEPSSVISVNAVSMDSIPRLEPQVTASSSSAAVQPPVEQVLTTSSSPVSELQVPALSIPALSSIISQIVPSAPAPASAPAPPLDNLTSINSDPAAPSVTPNVTNDNSGNGAADASAGNSSLSSSSSSSTAANSQDSEASSVEPQPTLGSDGGSDSSTPSNSTGTTPQEPSKPSPGGTDSAPSNSTVPDAASNSTVPDAATNSTDNAAGDAPADPSASDAYSTMPIGDAQPTYITLSIPTTATTTSLALAPEWSFLSVSELPSLIVAPTASSATSAASSAETADPSQSLQSLPLAIVPANVILPSSSENFTLITIGFTSGLSWLQTVSNQNISVIILAYTPLLLADALGIDQSRIMTSKLSAYSAAGTSGDSSSLLTQYEAYIPSDQVTILENLIHDTSSALYTTASNPILKQLTGLIDPKMALLANVNAAATDPSADSSGSDDNNNVRQNVLIGIGSLVAALIAAVSIYYGVKAYRQRQANKHHRLSDPPVMSNGRRSPMHAHSSSVDFDERLRDRNSFFYAEEAFRPLAMSAGPSNEVGSSRFSQRKSRKGPVKISTIGAPKLLENSLGW